MSNFGDDVQALRKHGLSDGDILGKAKVYYPGQAQDIEALLKHGLNDTQVLDKLVEYKRAYPGGGIYDTESRNGVPESQDNRPIAAKALDNLALMGKAVAYGAQDEANRLGETAKDTIGTDVGLQTAADATKTLTDNYDPASAHITVNPKTWSYAPRAALEGVASTGGYLGASAAGGALAGSVAGPEAVPVGGALGMGLYGLARALGVNAKQRAANNGRQEATSQDVKEALPGAVAEGALGAVGGRYLKDIPVTGAGAEAMLKTLKNLGKATAANAGTSAAADVANQLGTSVGTDKGVSLDPEQIANAGVAGGLTSAITKAGLSAGQVANNVRYGDKSFPEGAEAKARVAKLMQGTRVSGDPNIREHGSQIIDNTDSVLNDDLTQSIQALRKAQGTEQTQERSPTGSQGLRPSGRLIDDIRSNLSNGSPLDKAQLKLVNQSLPQDVAGNISALSVLNRLKAKVDTAQDTESSSNVYHRLSVLHAMKHVAPALGLGAMHFNPIVGMGIMAAPVLKPVLGRVLNIVTGNGNPVGEFVQRFGQEQKLLQDPKPVEPPAEPVELLPTQDATEVAQGNKGQPAVNSGASEERRSDSQGSSVPSVPLPKTVKIETPYLNREQVLAHVRRSPEAIAAGIAKRAGTRSEVAEAAKALPLSTLGKAQVVSKVPELLSAANGANTKAQGDQVLSQWLEGFSKGDQEVLTDHFAKAVSTHGLRWRDSWGHKTKADADKAQALNAAVAKGKITKGHKKK